MKIELQSFITGGHAIVVGASGSIGAALVRGLEKSASFSQVTGLSRRNDGFDLLDEASIAATASTVASMALPLRLVIVATGVLHAGDFQPEKTWRQLDLGGLTRAFAVNAIGPALVAKHFLPLLPRQGKAVFAALSAKVGSIGDNHLGGWYSYRASKAALNQLIRTAAIELARSRPDAICLTLHPGTVASTLSAPFSSGHSVVEPDTAAERLLRVVDGVQPKQNGLLINHSGQPLPW
ncbi:MAG: SDR family NAD(P)-dependent oxidoreductase [Candidatus Devosia phytovorans]|uniref:SDR family NAD(P)-dependent oxidoreductase n=1 Tax=Candidatus Devosia phytovorans TaxID=3121372 RepID=A0AAJ6AY70_9HYPH|nr:SDR family NAD(P)-dependent oxidoreductase [Devosia sp.]WEK03245.1 MAG: SDR family NAD(P)-dependent oxidoreductase [Devosia sp.]